MRYALFIFVTMLILMFAIFSMAKDRICLPLNWRDQIKPDTTYEFSGVAESKEKGVILFDEMYLKERKQSWIKTLSRENDINRE